MDNKKNDISSPITISYPQQLPHLCGHDTQKSPKRFRLSALPAPRTLYCYIMNANTDVVTSRNLHYYSLSFKGMSRTVVY